MSSLTVLGGGRALLDLLEREVFLVGGDMPLVPERILEAAEPVAVELVCHRTYLPCAGTDRLLEHRVDVLDIEHDAYRRAADRLRTARVHLRKLVGEHDPGITDLDLGVPDPSIGLGHPHLFF